MRGSSFHRLYHLLRPELRPRLPALVATLVLASLVSFGQKAPILLIDPLLNRVLFPEAAVVEVAFAKAPPEGLVEVLEHRIDRARDTSLDAVFGPPSQPDDRHEVSRRVAWILVGLAVLSAVGQYAFTWISRYLGFSMIVGLRQRIAKHLLGLSMRYHGERHFGDLLSRVSSDVTQTLGAVNVAIKNCIEGPLLVTFSLGAAFFLAPAPTVFVVVFLPLISAPISALGRRVRRRSRKSLASLGESVEVLTQMFQGIRTVKAFRAEERELDRYRERNAGYLDSSMKMVRAVSSIESATTFLSSIGLASLLVLIVWMNGPDKRLFDDAGEMAGFLLAISVTYGHLKRLTSSINKVQEAAGAADRLQALLDEQPDLVERPGARSIDGLGSGVALEDVTFTYAGADRPAVAGLSLELIPGETLALVGPSGAGKTTVMDLIARFLDPDEGRVAVDGVDLRDVTLDAWTRQFAMVGQVPFLFHTTIEENIRYGHPGASKQEVEAAARAANIHDFIVSLPEGYATQVGDAGARLSGGQRQRITIARAVLKQAPLLLLDEATSALDSESELVVQEALERLMSGRTVVVIAHRLSTIRGADRIAVLEEGRLIELGTHEELLRLEGTYARLHAVQFASTPSS